MKKLLIVDANSILNRAFWGVRPLTTKAGLNTNAVFGYVNILLKHINAISPDYAAAAFDLKAPTFRHKMYAEYKAGRRPMPPELKEQVPYIKEVGKALGVTTVSLEGYEADDILGTLSKRFENIGHTYIVTGDRDSLQLVSENTTVILANNSNDEEYTPEKVLERYQVTPERLIDVKAIMGDSSDNIPGVAGIGEKGAIKLISENVNLETLYSRFENGEIKLSPSLAEKLKNGKESAFFSRTLATICRDVPLENGVEAYEKKDVDKKTLASLFKTLEFTKLSEKLGLIESESFTQTEEEQNGQLTFDTDSVQERREVVTEDTFVMCDEPVFLDFDPINKMFSRLQEDKVISVPSSKSLLEKLSQKSLVMWDSKPFWREVEDACATVLCDAVKFDVKLAAYVENPETRGDFQHIVMRYLSRSISTVFSDSAEYRCRFVKELYESLEKTLNEIGANDLYYTIELPLARVLARMEECGFTLDTERLKEYGEVLKENLKKLENDIHSIAGEVFNINSPKQLGHVLFEKMGLPVIKKKKSGYSTDAETLEKLRFHSPLIDFILEYRKLAKLHGTYVEGLLAVAGADGRIRTEFKQTGTLTGRLSSAEPNLQNIPVRTEEGSIFRRFFMSDNGKVLVDADYSQIELRILAHMAGDDVMISAFNSGLDIHTVTASEVFGVDINSVTPQMRSRAKAVNFGIVYGIGEYSLSQDLKISIGEAKSYINGYFKTYKKVKEYLDKTVENARENGYVETLFSRRRYIPELSSSKKPLQAFGERVAMNTPIQGTAADVIKKAMVAVDKRLTDENMKTRLILQVHDELILEAPENEAEKAAQILKEEMENAVNLSVSLTSDVGIGKNWLEAKK